MVGYNPLGLLYEMVMGLDVTCGSDGGSSLRKSISDAKSSNSAATDSFREKEEGSVFLEINTFLSGPLIGRKADGPLGAWICLANLKAFWVARSHRSPAVLPTHQHRLLLLLL